MKLSLAESAVYHVFSYFRVSYKLIRFHLIVLCIKIWNLPGGLGHCMFKFFKNVS